MSYKNSNMILSRISEHLVLYQLVLHAQWSILVLEYSVFPP